VHLRRGPTAETRRLLSFFILLIVVIKDKMCQVLSFSLSFNGFHRGYAIGPVNVLGK